MEKQPTENITIPVWRYDLLVKAETMLELAKQIHRNNDAYDADKLLKPILGPKNSTEKKKCETI